MAEAPGSPAVDYDAAQDVALTVLCHLAARRSDFLHPTSSYPVTATRSLAC